MIFSHLGAEYPFLCHSLAISEDVFVACNICSIYIDLLNKVRLNRLEHSGYHAQDYLFCAVANSTAQQGLAYHRVVTDAEESHHLNVCWN